MKALLLLLPLALTSWAQQTRPAKPKASPPRTEAFPPAAPSPKTIVIRRGSTRPAPPKPAVFDYSFGLSFPPFPTFSVPQGDRFKLPNGLTVHLQENRRLPAVRGILLVPTGSVNDPPEKAGLAYVTALSLRSGGTAALPGPRLDEALDLVGVSLSADVSQLVSSLSFAVLSENLTRALSLFHDVLTQPAFEDDAFDMIRGGLRDRVGGRNYDPDLIAAREFSAALYGASSPLSRRIEYEHLDNIGREDVVNFYQTRYAPASSVLVIEGDFAAAELKSTIISQFSDWAAPRAQTHPYPKLIHSPAPGLRFADKRDARRSAVLVGLLGPQASEPTFAASLAAAFLFGGGPGSRLHKALASKQQWEAQIAANLLGGDVYPASVQIKLSCRPSFTTELVQFVLAEIETFRAAPPLETDLRDAVSRAQAEIALQYQPLAALLAESERTALVGLGADRLPALQRQLTSLTPADVHRAAQGWTPDALLMVVVGSSTLFDSPLTSLGRPILPIDLSIPSPKPVAPRTDPESISRGQDWLKRMQQAMGGLDKLQSVKDWLSVAEGSVWLGSTSMKIKETNKWLAPHTLRQEQDLPYGRSVLFYNGEVGWIARPTGLAQMSLSMIRQAEDELLQLPFTLALSNLTQGRTVCSLGANIIQITSGPDKAVRVYFDEQTGLPARLTYLSEATGSRSVMVEHALSNWREFDGIRMPTRIIVKHNGRKFTDLTIQSTRFNSGISGLDLGRRP